MQGGHDLDCRPKKCFNNNVLTKMLKVLQVVPHQTYKLILQ